MPKLLHQQVQQKETRIMLPLNIEIRSPLGIDKLDSLIVKKRDPRK